MAVIGDIANEFIREEIEEFIERDNERQRNIDLFASARPLMQDIGPL